MALQAFNPFGKSEEEKLDYYIQALREGKTESALMKEATAPAKFAQRTIQSAGSPTALSALAKTLASGLNRAYSDKAEAGERSVLKQALAEKAAKDQMATMQGMPEGIDPAMIQTGITSGEISPQDIEAMQVSPEQQFQVAKDAALKQERDQRSDDVNRARIMQLEQAESAISAGTTMIDPTTGETMRMFTDAQGRPVDQQGQPVDVGDRITMAEFTAERRAAKAADRTGGFKPSAAEMKSYRGMNKLEKKFDILDSEFAQLSASQQAMLDQPIAEIGLGVLGAVSPEGVNRLAEENVAYPDQAVRSYRTQVAKIESDYSKLMSGLAVTGFEMKDRKKWSPYAEGISQGERQSRLDNLCVDLESEKESFAELYPTFALPASAPTPGGEQATTAANLQKIHDGQGDDPSPSPEISQELWDAQTPEQKEMLRERFQ